MNNLEKARALDKQGHPDKAYELYLDGLETEDGDFNDYVNTAVISFLIQDYGFSQQYSIDEKTIDASWSGMYDLLDQCERKFGSTQETLFWRNYFKLILEGKSEFESWCSSYIGSLGRFSEPVSEKERYINSIYESYAANLTQMKRGKPN